MASDLKLQVILSAIDKATGPIRDITRGSGKMAATFRASRDQLKELNKQQADVRAYRVANVEATRQARTIRDLTAKARGYSQSLEEQRAVHTNLRGNLKAAQTQYNKLSKAMLDGKGGSAEFQRELQKAQIKLTASRQAFERSNASIKTYKERLRSTNDRLFRTNQQHKTTQERLSGLKTRLDAAGIGTEGLRSKAQTLRQEQERMNQTLDRQRAALERVNAIQQRNKQLNERHAKTMGRAAMVGAAGYAGVAMGRNILTRSSGALAPGVDYAAQMSELQAITRLGKDDQRMAMLRAQARELGATTAFTAADVGAGQTFLARAGFSPEAIHASMQDMLNLALANGVDLGRTADIASNISSAFKIDPEVEGNIGRVADVLSGTAARSNVNLEMLGETMKYLGGAEDLKLSLEQAAAMAGLMGNIGIQGSQAGTAMRAMMNRLTGPAKAGAKAMEELGLKVEDAQGNMRSMPEILRDINTATKDMGNVQRKAILTRIFGAEAGSGMAELVSQMSEGGLDDLLEQIMHGTQGENARMAATMTDNIKYDLKGLVSAWEEVGISMTEANEGPIRQLIASVTDFVRRIGQWINANPELVATLAKVVGVVGILAAVGGSLAITLASLIAPISLVMFGFGKMVLAAKLVAPALGAALNIVLLLGKALLTTKLGLFAAMPALAALAFAAVMLVKHWDKVKAFFAGFIPEFIAGFKGMLQVLLDGVGYLLPVLRSIATALAPVVNWIKSLIAPAQSTGEALQQATSAGAAFGKVIGPLAALTGVALAIKAVGAAMLGLAAKSKLLVASVKLASGALFAYSKMAVGAVIAGTKAATAALLAKSKALAVTLVSAAKAASAVLLSLARVALVAVISAIKTAGVAMWALAANPVFWAIATGVAIVAGAGYLLWRNWDQISAGIQKAWSALATGARSTWEAITAFFAGIWSQIKTAFDGGLLGISQLIINWSPLGLFYQAFAGVMGYFGVDLPGKFTEFGGMLMNGMVQGIRNGLGAVRDAITGAGDQAIGWFKDKLGIRSPSRVFAALGDDTMAGLEQGLERSKPGPLASIIEAGKAIAGAATVSLGVAGTPAVADIAPLTGITVDSRPPLQAAAAPVTVQGDTIHIQITAAPGTDTRELERMVNRVLEERERNKAARIRSSLYDND